MTYTADKPPLPETPDELRARIPGWGADLDPRDRPSVPKLLPPGEAVGAPWTFPDRQPDDDRRERSIEHAFLTPVYGTSCPRHGLSGAIRGLAYRRYSEARAAHWLLLILGDRVDAWENHLWSLATSRPDDVVTESGVAGELGHHPVASRSGRVDVGHQALDPLVVAGRWAAMAAAVTVGLRGLRRRRPSAGGFRRR